MKIKCKLNEMCMKNDKKQRRKRFAFNVNGKLALGIKCNVICACKK